MATKPSPKRLARESADIVEAKVLQLKQIVPECFSEGVIDAQKLCRTLGQVDSRDEKYTFNWAGRTDTFKSIQTPSRNTLVPDKTSSVNFDNTENIFIEGENLEILKLLQKPYFGKIKVIYIDPPYNTGSDFIYKDNFRDDARSYLEQTGQSKDGINLTTNPETDGRFHSNWISFMYARLFLARNLLADNGAIFVSIDDNEIHNLKMIMNEIFGEENFRSSIVIKRGAKNVQAQFDTIDRLGSGYESVLMYSKSASHRFKKLMRKLDEVRPGSWNNHWRGTDRPTMRYTLFGITPEKGQWRWSKMRSEKAARNYDMLLTELNKHNVSQSEIDDWYAHMVEHTGHKIDLLRLSKRHKVEHYVPPTDSQLLNDVWYDIVPNGSRTLTKLLPDVCFETPKPLELINRMVEFVADDQDIVLDFFAGSGTTAQAILEANHAGRNQKFILVQFPEKIKHNKHGLSTIADVCKERIRQSIKIVGNSENRNLGFKAFKLSGSNFKSWEDIYQDKDKLKKQMRLLESTLKDGSDLVDVIYECILREGLSLNSKIEDMGTGPNSISRISDGEGPSFYLTLDASIDPQTPNWLGLGRDDTLICLDAALDDGQKANISALCRLKTI